ncbi:MAG TPA: ATP-binding protein [Candidatus Paceibacterota bacterium]|nr:ATP-binding protein [Verrucomicrobiota bacterium]HSA11021.1 ATP-binding protein [Candidatus Paceibacterota bacterium]
MNPHLNPLLVMLADQSVPLPHRVLMLRELLQNTTPETEPLIGALFETLTAKSSDAVYKDKVRKLDAQLKEIREGPMRRATFIELAKINGDAVSQALVALDDGTLAYAVVVDEEPLKKLRRGDPVILDGKARVLVDRAPGAVGVGDEARLERKIDDQRIEVTSRGEERLVVWAAAGLIDDVDAGKVTPGSAIVLGSRQTIGLAALPNQDRLANFRFLDKGPVPDVLVERDIGCPPKVIREVAEHIRQEMTQPELRRRFRLRPCLMKLLCGVSGSGKTLAVQAIHRLMYETMSDVTGVPIGQLPSRVFHLRQSQVLSKWLGESDKNVDCLFNEIEQLADQDYTAPDGRRFHLPVLVIIEEADGMSRARGQDAIYDRILTTFLQRLDPARARLRDRLVVFLATTNEPHIVDPAFLRRIGGSIEKFGRLNRQSFRAVLHKLMCGLPAAANNGSTQQEILQKHITDLTAWLFGPNADPGVVELTYAGSTTPVIKHRRDFLTGALIDRAVQEAATEAWRSAQEDPTSAGLTLAHLMRALNNQVLSVVGQLCEQNVGSYTDLPDGVRVASLRRIPQPTHLPIEFIRNPNL